MNDYQMTEEPFDVVTEVRELLLEASELEAEARDRRRLAGRYLAAARANDPHGDWLTYYELDERSAEVLIDLGSGVR